MKSEGTIALCDTLRAGKRFPEAERCYRSILESAPDHAGALNGLGKTLNNMGNPEAAAAVFGRLVHLQPQLAEGHHNLAHARLMLGQLEPAESGFRDALNIEPHRLSSLHGLANVLNSQRHDSEALETWQLISSIDPDDEGALYNAAQVMQNAGQMLPAITKYKKLMTLRPKDADAASNLAACYLAIGDLAQARVNFDRALMSIPDHQSALAGIAGLMDLAGDYQRGTDLLAPIVESGHAAPQLLVAYGQLLRRLDRKPEALDVMSNALASGDLGQDEQLLVWFSLGDINNDLGHYDQAFSCYRKANALIDTGYSSHEHQRQVSRTRRVFSRHGLKDMSQLGIDQHPRLLFIVGMPRSGTSLVEQILACHPAMHAMGEHGGMGTLVRDFAAISGQSDSYPGGARHLSAEHLGRLRDWYLQSMGKLPGSAHSVTDKMWKNFEHLGLVQMMFPEARVIHCRRHPMDTGLSCFFQSFGAVGPGFSYDLADIGAYYQQYELLMAHWKQALDLPILDVSYEHMVADQEPQTRRLLEFCGLDWDPACLQFHKLKRVVKTASHAQVRKPIYQSSKKRYLNYDAHLAPLREALGDYGKRYQGETI